MINSQMYPGAHVKYSFELPGLYFDEIKLLPMGGEVKAASIECDLLSEFSYHLLLHLGPVTSEKQAREVCEHHIPKIQNLLVLSMQVKYVNWQFHSCELETPFGELNRGEIELPVVECHGEGKSYPSKLSKDECASVAKMLNMELNSDNDLWLCLFRHAISVNNPVAQFVDLYHILDFGLAPILWTPS